MSSLGVGDQNKIVEARLAALKSAEDAFDKLDINGDGDIDRDEVQ